MQGFVKLVADEQNILTQYQCMQASETDQLEFCDKTSGSQNCSFPSDL